MDTPTARLQSVPHKWHRSSLLTARNHRRKWGHRTRNHDHRERFLHENRTRDKTTHAGTRPVLLPGAGVKPLHPGDNTLNLLWVISLKKDRTDPLRDGGTPSPVFLMEDGPAIRVPGSASKLKR